MTMDEVGVAAKQRGIAERRRRRGLHIARDLFVLVSEQHTPSAEA